MDFSETLKALKAGKKVKLPDFEEGTYLELRNGNYYIKYKSGSIKNDFSAIPIRYTLAEDWEIVEDIPKVKLQRSTDTYFECPNCGAHREVIVYNEDIINNENIRECFKCGTKVKIVNLGEFNKECSQVEALSEYKTWLQHIIEISDQDILTYAGEMNFVKAGEYEIRRGVFEECLGALNEIGVLK